MRTKYISLAFVLIIMGFNSYFVKSQTCTSIKLNTISYQFSDNNTGLATQKLTKNGQLAIEPGIIFAYESFASSTASLKLNLALYLDKTSKMAGFPQVLIRFRLFNAFKHSMTIGFGPALYFRQTWSNTEGYVDDGAYNIVGEWQYKLAWLSGELEYNYYLTKNSNMSISLNLIRPESVGIAIGYKYWISKKPKRKRGCVTCPSFH